MPEDTNHLEQQLAAQAERLRTLELWKATQDTNFAVRTERDKHLDLRFDRVELSINEVKGYLLKIVWVIILGVLGAFITFVLRGGLSGPT
jgi:hypothetical protein